MTRLLAALVASLLLIGVAVQAAPAWQHEKPPPRTPVTEVEATAAATGDGSTASATAFCPRRTRVAGGGFRAPYSTDVIGLVYESVKVKNRGWRASVQLLDPADPSTLTLTTYAYCRHHFPRTRTRSSTAPTTGETGVGPTVPAGCRRGEDAVAGGFDMPPPLHTPTLTSLYLDSLRSGTSAWTTRVVTGPAEPSTVRSEVYCSRRGEPPVEATGSSEPNGSDFTQSMAMADCPDDSAPAAGGFAQPDSELASFFFIFESRKVGDAWWVSGLHSGSDPAVALNAYAYCAPGSTVADDPVDPDDTTVSDAEEDDQG